MNKGHLIRAVAARLGVSEAVAEENVEAVLEEIARSLVRHEDVSVTGFGRFSVVQTIERPGRNMATGEMVRVPSRSVVRFKAGVRLLEHVRGEKTAPADGKVVTKLYGHRPKGEQG